MKYKIFSDGNEINTIVSDEDFCKKFCEKNGYTYEELLEPAIELKPETDPEPTTEEILNVLLGVNADE